MHVQINDLVVTYGKHRALNGITLGIEGGMFGLLGPNGAGKTTLMKVLTTLLPPTRGQVQIGAIDVAQDPSAARRSIGYLPQDFGFYKGLNAYEMLDYIGTMKNIPSPERKRQVEEALDLVNLTADARRRVGGYSGGMKQRLGIAQALLGNPPVLVVDEPTAGLDPEERMRFRNLLARLSGRRTVILSTHIVADIEASCSRLAVLRKGQLAFTGTAEELMDAARGQVWQMEVNPADYEQLANHFQIVNSRSTGPRMLLRILSRQNPLGRGTPVEPGLEDGYLAVMGGGPRA